MEPMKIEAVSGLHPRGRLEELRAALASGRDPFSEPAARECGPAAFDNLEALGPALRRTPRLARLALSAALDLPGFGVGAAGIPPGSGLIVSTAFASVRCAFDFIDSLLRDGPGLASPTAFSHSVANMTAALLGLHLRIAGPALTVTDAGGSPFRAALVAAEGALASGRVEKVLLCAAEERHPLMDEIIRSAGGGTPPAEGAVCLVLGRRSGEEWPHVRLVPAPARDRAADPLAPAWETALAFLALRSGGAGAAGSGSGGGGRDSGIVVEPGARP